MYHRAWLHPEQHLLGGHLVSHRQIYELVVFRLGLTPSMLGNLFTITVALLACACCCGSSRDRTCGHLGPAPGTVVDELHGACAISLGIQQYFPSVGASSLGAEEGRNLLQVKSSRASKLPSVESGTSPRTSADLRSVDRPLRISFLTIDPHLRVPEFNDTKQVARFLESGATFARGVVANLLKPAKSAGSRSGILFVGLAFLLLACLVFFSVQSNKHIVFPPREPRSQLRHDAVQLRHEAAILSQSSLSQSYPASASNSPFLGGSLLQVATPPRPHVSPSGRKLNPGSSARLSPVQSSRQPSLAAVESPGQISQGSHNARVPHLCPGLVVPNGNECHLAVPVLSSPRDASAAGTLAFEVQDLNGNCVVTAEFLLSGSGKAGFDMTNIPLFTLRAAKRPGAPRRGEEPRVLAYCRTAKEAASRTRVCIYDSRDEPFAMVYKDPSYSRYTLSSSRIPLHLYIEGEASKRTMKVTNDQRQLLAETSGETMSFNPSGTYYKLRVGSDVDVGLVLCALFSVYSLELA